MGLLVARRQQISSNVFQYYYCFILRRMGKTKLNFSSHILLTRININSCLNRSSGASTAVALLLIIVVIVYFCFFFRSSGGWVKLKLKLSYLHASDACCVNLTRRSHLSEVQSPSYASDQKRDSVNGIAPIYHSTNYKYCTSHRQR